MTLIAHLLLLTTYLAHLQTIHSGVQQPIWFKSGSNDNKYPQLLVRRDFAPSKKYIPSGENPNDASAVFIATEGRKRLNAKPVVYAPVASNDVELVSFKQGNNQQDTMMVSAFSENRPVYFPPKNIEKPREYIDYDKQSITVINTLTAPKTVTNMDKPVNLYDNDSELFAPDLDFDNNAIDSQDNLTPSSGLRRLDSQVVSSGETLIYEDIYPVRVSVESRQRHQNQPQKLPAPWWDRQEQDLENERWRNEERARKLRRLRARRRYDQQQRLRLTPVRKHLRQQRARTIHGTARTSDNNRSVVRSMLGVAPFCLADDVQFQCTFTPTCWLSGGIPQSGCDSMLYSCCVMQSALPRKVNFF